MPSLDHKRGRDSESLREAGEVHANRANESINAIDFHREALAASRGNRRILSEINRHTKIRGGGADAQVINKSLAAKAAHVGDARQILAIRRRGEEQI